MEIQMSQPPSETVERKFIESYSVDDYQVLTDTGFVDVLKVNKTIPYEVWHLQTENHSLRCADTHILFRPDLSEVFARDLVPGDFVLTDSGPEKVISVSPLGFSDNMYDLELPEGSNHRYYGDGVLSHNTTSYTIFCLWYATFFPDKKIMICANKLQTAIEIMGRIQKAYEYLPRFLKASVITYNKSEIEFSNGSVIKGFATGSSSARGFSGNCVTGDTKVGIRFKAIKFLKLTVPISWLRFLGKTTKVKSSVYESGKEDSPIKRFYGATDFIKGIQVRTDHGWADAERLLWRDVEKTMVVQTKDSSGETHELRCTECHVLYDSAGEPIYAKDTNGKFVQTERGVEQVFFTAIVPNSTTVYDISLRDDPHTYYTNGFLSHNCVILDEFSFVQKNLASDFFASVMPIISSGKNSKAIIVSTPNGTDNLYYEIWKAATSKEASKNKEGWKPFRIDWWEAGGIRDEKWKQQQIATIGIQRWNQEFGNEFLDSATTKKLIPDDVIERYRIKITERRDSGKDQGKDLYVSSKDGRKTYVFRMWH